MKELEQLLELNKDIDTLLDKLAVISYHLSHPKKGKEVVDRYSALSAVLKKESI